jgi:cytoskeleton protein RodZ
MSQEDIVINGELLRIRREARGWVLNDMATRACMSVKQIRQLEEGGMSSFYSAAVKMTSAKKVGALLGLSAEEVFAQEVELPSELSSVEPEAVVYATEVLLTDNQKTEPVPEPLAQEVVHADVDTRTTQTSASPAPVAPIEESKSKTSLWVIAGLFVAALAVAAYMQPQDEPVVETAPPLQALPIELADPASAASGADLPASSADVVALPASATSAVVAVPIANVQKQAPSVAAAASAPRVAASLVSGVAPVISRPASSSLPAPAASTASKAP